MIKRIYIFTILLLATMAAGAQVYQTDPAFGRQFNRVRGSVILTPPYYQDSASLPALPIAYAGTTKSDSTTGSLAFTRADSSLWYFSGTTWLRLTRGGSGSSSPCDTCITHISYRPGENEDTLYYTTANGNTDWYYLPVSDGLWPGTGIVTGTGLPGQYYVSAAIFRKRGVRYQTRDTTITVPAVSPDSNRTDIFIATTSGVNTTIQGIEGASALTPQYGLDTAVILTTIDLSAARPSGMTDTLTIYDDGTSPPEWTGTGAGVTVNTGATGAAFRGTKYTSVGALTNGDRVNYTGTTLINQTMYGGISFFIKLPQNMPSNNNLYISFFNGATQVSSEVAIPLNKSNFSNYQGISIGFASFTWLNNLFDRVSIRYSGNGYSGLSLDFIYLQNGIPPVVVSQNFVQNIRRVGNTIEQAINNAWQPAFNIGDKADTATQIIAGIGLNGGGSLSATRTIDADTLGTLATKTDLASKLNRADSVAGGYYPYSTNPKGYLVADDITGKTNNSDTGTMLAPYPNLFNYPLIKSSKTVSADTGRAPNALATGGGLTKVADSLAALISAGAGITQLTGDVTAGPGSGSQAATIAANAVTYAKMQQMVGLSLLGNATNATANMAPLTAGTDHHVLRRSGTGIGFGTLNAAAMNPTYTNGYTLQTDGSGNLSWVAGGGGGVTALSAIGATPNANGATITGSTLNLQPASSSFGGVVTTGSQTFAGEKIVVGAAVGAGVGATLARSVLGASGSGTTSYPYLSTYNSSNQYTTGFTATHEGRFLIDFNIQNAANSFFGVRNKFSSTDVMFRISGTSGSVGIGNFGDPFANNMPNSLAALDITSSTKGLLIPRMTAINRNAISGSPPANLIITNTELDILQDFNGNAWTVTDGTLFTQYADKTVANTTAETSLLGTGLGTNTIPGSFIHTGNSFSIKVYGYIKTNGTPTLNIKFKVGTATVATTNAVTLVSVPSNGYFEAECIITSRSTYASGSSMYAQGKVIYFDSQTSPNFISALSTSTVNGNHAGAQAVDVTATWGTADLNNSITVTNCIVQMLN